MTGGRTVALSNSVEYIAADGLDIVVAIGAELCSYYVLFPNTLRPLFGAGESAASEGRAFAQRRGGGPDGL